MINFIPKIFLWSLNSTESWLFKYQSLTPSGYSQDNQAFNIKYFLLKIWTLEIVSISSFKGFSKFSKTNLGHHGILNLCRINKQSLRFIKSYHKQVISWRHSWSPIKNSIRCCRHLLLKWAAKNCKKSDNHPFVALIHSLYNSDLQLSMQTDISIAWSQNLGNYTA